MRRGPSAATFNAPIAGVMFAMEVILGNFASRSFGLVVIASVTSTAISQAFLGREPAFRLVESFSLVSEWEFLLYLALGVFTGLIALAYVQSVYWFEDSFDAWKLSPGWKALIGGLGVGALGFFGSDLIFGVGHEGVELALQGEMALGLMLGLVVLKIIATSVTLGAGGSGGIFAPALFVGAMAGGAFGKMANGLFPAFTAPPGAYALVGMASLFAAAAHAPITGILILFEMTDNYRIILPLMFAVVVAHLMASAIYRDSIYSIKLRRKGGLAAPKKEMGVLDLVLVADAMTPDFETVRDDLPLEDLADLARAGKVRSWLVLDEADGLCGIVAETDLELAIVSGGLQDATVRDIMTTGLTTCTPGSLFESPFAASLIGPFIRFRLLRRTIPGRSPESSEETNSYGLSRSFPTNIKGSYMKTGAEVAPSHEDSVQLEVQVKEGLEDLCFKRVRYALPKGTLIVLLRRGAGGGS